MQVSVHKSSPPPLTGVQQVVSLAKSAEQLTSCITATSCGNTFQHKEEKQTIPEREQRRDLFAHNLHTDIPCKHPQHPAVAVGVTQEGRSRGGRRKILSSKA